MNYRLRTAAYQTREKFLKPLAKLFNNNRWDSVPFFIWATLFILTQWHRATIYPESAIWAEASAVYATPILMSLFFMWMSVTKKLHDKVLFASVGAFGISLWMLFATALGRNLPIFITGFALTVSLGIPFWLASAKHSVEKLKAVNPPRMDSPALPAAPKTGISPFETVPYLKGGEWSGPDIPTQTGSVRRLRLPAGLDARAFCATRTGGMANVLHVSPDDVELIEVPGQGHHVDVYTHTYDVLKETQEWPNMRSHSLSILEPIPIGVMRDNSVKYLDLMEKHLLVGGESGSGKSNLLTMIVATGALDPNCDVWMMDGKRTELFPWRMLGVGYIQDDMDAALEMLNELQTEMGRRQDLMNALDIRKFTDADGAIRPMLLIIDELARYLRFDDRAKTQEFIRRLSDLLDRGRSAGLMVVAVTQVPSKRLLTGDMKRGFTHRIALRVMDTDASEMILERRIPDASLIPEHKDYTGYGYVKEGGQPRKFRAFWVPDASIKTIVIKGHDPDRVWDLSAGPKLKELVAANGEPTFPDGTPIPVARQALWDALEGSAQTVSELAGEVDASKPTVRKTLDEWVAAGHIKSTTTGNTKYYSK